MLGWDISADYDVSDLGRAWTALEAEATCGFFLSWRWVGCWLRAVSTRPLLARATQGGVTVALALLSRNPVRRHFLPVRQLCLHETGQPLLDGAGIEYNGILMARLAPPDTVTSLFHAIKAFDSHWDEILLGGVSPEFAALAGAAQLVIEIDRDSPAFAASLSNEDNREGISANLRGQLRQARKIAERDGPLGLTAAGGATQALEFFDEMVSLHTAYWNGRGKPGAFASERLCRFHRDLIAAPFYTGPAMVELLRLSAGTRTLGYLYNFQYGDRIYAYQSGFAYNDDNRHRPGLLAHTMAMARGVEAGLRMYDFLAGDAPYKARLGRPAGRLLWCRAQRRRPLLTLERKARALRQRLRRQP